MRILALTTNYPRPGHETAAPYNREQLRALARDHEVAVVAPLFWTEVLRDRWAGTCAPRSGRNADGLLIRHPLYFYPPKVLQHRYGAYYLASVRATFERVRAEFRPDVVLSCFAHPDGWAAERLAHEAGLPAVTKVIGSDVLVSARHGRRAPKVAEALRRADAVVAVSRDLAGHVVRLGVEPGRVHVVPEGIDLALFTPGDRAEARARLRVPAQGRMILFVGNLLRTKGVGVLVEACALLVGRGFEFTCRVVGRGRDERQLRALAARLRLTDRVHFAGPRPHAELPDWYRACDVVALPSFSEGIPNVLREASACGRPFVASRVGGIPEVADPSSSLLVEPGSVRGLADALQRALGEGLGPGTGPAPDSGPITWEESARRLGHVLRQAVEAPRSSGQPLWDAATPDAVLAGMGQTPILR